jgi:hypothetical protein
METKQVQPSVAKRHPEFICRNCRNCSDTEDGGYYYMSCLAHRDKWNNPVMIDPLADGPNDDGTVDIVTACESHEKHEAQHEDIIF